MNLKTNLVLLAALALTLGVRAENTVITPKTNNVMVLNVTLTAYPNAAVIPAVESDTAGGDASQVTTVSNTPFRILSKDIITALNGVTNDGVVLHFGSGAALFLKQIVSPRTVVTNGLGTNEQIIVRQLVSGHTEDTDVSSFFLNTVDYAATYSSSQRTTHEDLSMFSMVNPGKLGFSLSALASQTTLKAQSNGVPVIQSLNFNVLGAGQTSGEVPNLILSGTISSGQAQLQ